MKTTTFCFILCGLLFGPIVSTRVVDAQTVTEIFNRDDALYSFEEPRSITVDTTGHVYVLGSGADLYQMTPRGEVAWSMSLSNRIDDPRGLAVDAGGIVYVSGFESDNVLRIESGLVQEILDVSSGGVNILRGPRNIAVSDSGHVYVVGSSTDNVFEIRPDGDFTQIIGRIGDGLNDLDNPFGIAVDASGTVYVTGADSNNAFAIRADGTIGEIIDETGDGVNALRDPRSIGVDASGTVYVAGVRSNNVFAISPEGSIAQIIDETGDGVDPLLRPWDLAVEPSGFIHVGGILSDTVFSIHPDGAIAKIFDASGDGHHVLDGPSVLAATPAGVVYVGGHHSDNVFELSPRRGLSDSGGLLVPAFEASTETDGPTTLFAVRNTTDEPVTSIAEYLGTSDVEPLRTEIVELAPQATLTSDIRANLANLEIENGVARGVIRMTEPDDVNASSLTGDVFRVDAGNGFATGGRLIRPADFCDDQEVRFVDFGGGSTLRVLIDRPRGDEVPSFSYTAYDEVGTELVSGTHFTDRYLSELAASELTGVASFGTLRFDFTNSGGGLVSAAHSAFGRFSAEIDGACGDRTEAVDRADGGIARILAEEGNGEAILEHPAGIGGDALGNIYVMGEGSNNVFKISRAGLVTEIIDERGASEIGYDGVSKGYYGNDNRLRGAGGLAVSPSGHVYVTSSGNANVFEIDPDGTITRILDGNSDETPPLEFPTSIVVNEVGVVYLVGSSSDNVLEILPDGTVTQILDASGDGVHPLDYPDGLAVSASGIVYVTGAHSDNVFEITPDGMVTQILDATGDGVNGLNRPTGVAVDSAGNVYVTGSVSDNVFKIAPDGAIRQILDATGDGTHPLGWPAPLAVSPSGRLFVVGATSDNVFEIAPDGTITQVLDDSGDGIHSLNGAYALYLEASGNIFVAGYFTNNLFEVVPPGALTATTELVVPGFEIAPDDPDGSATLFALRNTVDEPVSGVIKYMGLGGAEPQVSEPFELGPYETLTRNVGLGLAGLESDDGIVRGLILVAEADETTPSSLIGDYFRVDATNDFATGGQLVRPAEFCLRQEVRFVDFGADSTIRVLANRPHGDEAPSFSFTTYDESGTTVLEGDVYMSDYVTTLSREALAGAVRFGTVQFDFLASNGGWASVENSAFGEFSVEIEGACLDR